MQSRLDLGGAKLAPPLHQARPLGGRHGALRAVSAIQASPPGWHRSTGDKADNELQMYRPMKKTTHYSSKRFMFYLFYIAKFAAKDAYLAGIDFEM